ncbi:ADOP family duplicated permease [Paludibaculum fermentans]|uniref:ABC transporter permease n=1 Tax=Paludibaculum fermentans TaxID=1473598 RepID=A0A7S7SLH2_PALFE|nr:ADOP family duplicated permease [Paludibaculum fermentans]QOY90262.1 ABC transporter permease [Paludibaculum fermentans]
MLPEKEGEHSSVTGQGGGVFIFGSLERWLADLKYGGRTLRRSAGFTLTVLMTLALGLGGLTAVFCAMDRLLLQAVPYAEPDRLVALHETQLGKGYRPVSLANLMDWRAQSTSFLGMAGYMTRTFGLRGGSGEAGSAVSVIRTGMVTSELFPVLGLRPEQGRTFSEQEERAGQRVIVLTDALWTRQFGRASGVVGRTVSLNEEPYLVLGILPPGAVFPDPGTVVDAYIPLPHSEYSSRGARPLRAAGRLKPGVPLALAQAEIRAIGRRLGAAYPDDNPQCGADAQPLDDAWKGSLRRPLGLLSVAALLLFAIVCTNVVNLILSRALSRGREMAIRAALGAGLAAVVRQMLAEALLLSLGGAALGLALAYALLKALPLVLRYGGVVPPARAVALDLSTLFFATTLCLGVTILFGLAPALLLRRARLNATMNDGSLLPPAGGRRIFGLRQGLVAGQVALSLVLLLSAGAFLRVFLQLSARDPGFESEQVYYFGFGLPEVRYSENRMGQFHETLHRRLEEIPGVEAAGAAWRLPLNGRTNTTAFQFEGAGLKEVEWAWVAWNAVDPAYFEALRIPMVRGRPFSWALDRPGRPAAVLVNRSFERRYGLTGPVVGRRVQLRFHSEAVPKGALWEIVGVVGDTYQTGLDSAIRPQVYLPAGLAGLDGGVYVVRSARTDAGLVQAVEAAVRGVDPELERIQVHRLSEWVGESLGDRRTPAVLTGLFALVGLLLTVLGLYGTLMLEVRQRRRELAIRAALGADWRRILGLVLRRGLVLTGAGAAAGLLLFRVAGQVLEGQLYEVRPEDGGTAGVVLLVLAASALPACVKPAWAALRSSPVEVLREP